MTHGIRADYTENPVPSYYLDDVPSVRGITFQPDVYGMAEMLARMTEWWLSEYCSGEVPTILDVGAGWGEKLAAMHEREPLWKYRAVDFGKNAQHLRDTYPWLTVDEIDLEVPDPLDLANDTVVVFADVIEHLRDPAPVLTVLAESGAGTIVLSTPERDVEHGYDHLGPSPNFCHVREWNAAELHAYLESFGFTIAFHGLTRGSDQGWAMGTQIVVMQP